MNASDRRRDVIIVLTACSLAVAALALMSWPRLMEIVSGVRETPQLMAPDELPTLSSDDATGFFGERDQIEIRVASDTTLRKFLDRNRLNKPYHRAQIVKQLGSASPETRIVAGTVFKLFLTPTAADVPGATTTSKGPTR